jgi:arylsulfatase A-like enzyme
MKQNIFRTIFIGLFLILSIVYLEILFKIRVLAFDLNLDVWRIVLFSMSYGVLFVFFLKFFSEKVVKRLLYVIIVFITFLYFNQEIYSSFVEGFYSVSVIGDMTAGLSFFNDYLESIRFFHITYLLPLAVLILIDRLKYITFDISYCQLKHPLYFLIAFAGLFTIANQTISDEADSINLDGEEEPITLDNVGTLLSYSDRDLYIYMYNSQDALKKFGLLTYTYRDIATIFSRNPLSQEAYEVLITDYLDKQPSHRNNTYSGLFEDKNFILIMAESLDTFAINETLTPTLYKIKTENAYFNNYYSPLYYRSTADSEFLVQTSMFPDKNVTLSMDAYMENTFPNTFPQLFKEQGYSTYSFHNYFDYFYPRGNFHLNTLGYDQFWGSEELGMTTNFDPERIIVDHVWQSDYDMMKRAIPKFINDDKFFVNMLTVSGHFNYSENHELAKPEYVEAAQAYLDSLEEPVEYSDEILYYLAVHMEVDRAIAYLIEQLEDHNKLDDTVIMIFGDHYAYGIDNEDIWAYDSEYKIDNDELDLHNVPMMIVSNSNFLNRTHDKYMSTIDILPTVANLFNLNIVYNDVFGTDAMDPSVNVVRFADGSFLSSQFRYDGLSENYDIHDDAVTEQYLFQLHNKYLNDYMYNLLILEYDYFREDDDN